MKSAHPERRRRDTPVRSPRGVGAEFERFVGVFERGGREPIEGSVASAGGGNFSAVRAALR